ncbi:ATP-binding protein [Thioalkalivibrio sp. ALJT]|uniref:ATP-binding protein n=1 Tax=Thioalkalivibrio sp. ALJT TaxID=1158146 RepID=UPI00037F29E9|nr:ATP-binding protein [Thioalkalivibrio sp. ALJT]
MRWLTSLAPSSIFIRTTSILLVAFLTFAILTLGVVAHFTILPLARSAADDTAALMLLSGRSWAEIPPPARRGFNERLRREHGLRITQSSEPLDPAEKLRLPYLRFVQQSLSERVGFDVPLRPQDIDGERWYWVDLALGNQNLRIGFAHDRVATQRVEGALSVALITFLLVLLTALFMAGGTTRRIRRLYTAVSSVGQGQIPEPIPEKGPREVRLLARNFNNMALKVHQLLANRTTLLAGISHDLRTPLTRIRLSLEILRERPDPELIEGICNDLQAMDRIIHQSLALSRDLETREEQTVDINALLEQVIADAGGEEARILYRSAPDSCTRRVNSVALQRILSNLLENAVRYAGEEAIEVALECGAAVTIRILDRGPGIPEDELESVFQPFHRLEASRSVQTGGSGLGLAITRQLAEGNGWTVSLIPRTGGGIEARVRLPLDPKTAKSGTD